eukprot:PhM_4_TR16571/c0_g1_i1/m.100798
MDRIVSSVCDNPLDLASWQRAVEALKEVDPSNNNKSNHQVEAFFTNPKIATLACARVGHDTAFLKALHTLGAPVSVLLFNAAAQGNLSAFKELHEQSNVKLSDVRVLNASLMIVATQVRGPHVPGFKPNPDLLSYICEHFDGPFPYDEKFPDGETPIRLAVEQDVTFGGGDAKFLAPMVEVAGYSVTPDCLATAVLRGTPTYIRRVLRYLHHADGATSKYTEDVVNAKCCGKTSLEYACTMVRRAASPQEDVLAIIHMLLDAGADASACADIENKDPEVLKLLGVQSNGPAQSSTS